MFEVTLLLRHQRISYTSHSVCVLVVSCAYNISKSVMLKGRWMVCKESHNKYSFVIIRTIQLNQLGQLMQFVDTLTVCSFIKKKFK